MRGASTDLVSGSAPLNIIELAEITVERDHRDALQFGFGGQITIHKIHSLELETTKRIGDRISLGTFNPSMNLTATFLVSMEYLFLIFLLSLHQLRYPPASITFKNSAATVKGE